MAHFHESDNTANAKQSNRKTAWIILIAIPIIIFLIGISIYIYQTFNPIDLTNSFCDYFQVPDNKHIQFDSGYKAEILSFEKERSKEPIVILTLTPHYVPAETSIPYEEAVYEWMCIPNEIKKENLRKMSECVDAFVKSKGIEDACIYINFSCLSYGTVTYDQRMDTLWTPYRHEILKEMYVQYGTLSISELKDIPQAGNFYDIHKEELESYLSPYVFISNDGKSEKNFTTQTVLWQYSPS